MPILTDENRKIAPRKIDFVESYLEIKTRGLKPSMGLKEEPCEY